MNREQLAREVRSGKTCFDNVDFDGEDFFGLDLSGISFCYADFSHCDLSDARFTKCFFSGADFSDAYISKAKFNKCGMVAIKMNGANAMASAFYWCDLAGSRFLDADLEEANFLGSNLTGCDFSGALLKSTTLCNTEIWDTKFSVERPDFDGDKAVFALNKDMARAVKFLEGYPDSFKAVLEAEETGSRVHEEYEVNQRIVSAAAEAAGAHIADPIVKWAINNPKVIEAIIAHPEFGYQVLKAQENSDRLLSVDKNEYQDVLANRAHGDNKTRVSDDDLALLVATKSLIREAVSQFAATPIKQS